MRKYKIITFILALTFLGVFTKNINAATNQMLILSNTNSTCNIYAKPDGKQKLTYTNPLYQRDVPLLATSGSYYKIMISGVEGWIKKGEKCFNGGRAAVKNVSSIANYSFSTGGVKLSGLDVSRYQVVNNKMYFGLAYGAEYGPGYEYITYNIGYTDVPKGLKNNTVYYSYDGIYYYTNYNTMINDYKAKKRTSSTNYTNPYYDYYQYVPIRSTSKVSASALDKRLLQQRTDANKRLKETKSFNRSCAGLSTLKSNYDYYVSAVYNKGSAFTTKQSANNINAGALYGIMLNESAYGTSNYSRHYKNLFGWGANDSCPNAATVYSSIDSGIATYYSNMAKTYANPISYGGMGTQLGNKKTGANVNYASDPQWGYKNAYNYRVIDELAGNKDKNSLKLGIINSGKSATDGTLVNEQTKVYNSASTSAKSPYYYERNGASVIIQGESGSFYKIQNDTTGKGSVYIPKSKVYVANTTVSKPTTLAPAPKIEYEKVGSIHYIWGKNNVGQLGNGKTATVAKANRLNLSSLLPKGETIKTVIRYNNTNIFVLTISGNVYTSGSNTYGQRTYTSKANKFTKANPFNDRISGITITSNRLRMQRSNNKMEYWYVGRNGFNPSTLKANRTTSYPVKVGYYSTNKQKFARTYNYSAGKVSSSYYYNKSKKKTQIVSHSYASNKVKTYAKRTKYATNGKITHKMEWYYINGKLKQSGSKKPYRYSTYYSNGKATKTYKRTYSKAGKISKATRVGVRK